jgi:hypothetical protein
MPCPALDMGAGLFRAIAPPTRIRSLRSEFFSGESCFHFPSTMRRLFLTALLLSVLPGRTTAQFEVAPPDPLIGTVWNLLGTNRQKINELTFLKDGKVKCDKSYKNATWARVDKDNILFGYGVDSSYVVYRISDASGKEMRGYTYDGRVRYLQKIK